MLAALLLTAALAGEGTEVAPPPGPGEAAAIFAAGCFWCVEHAFEGRPGVLSVTSGYTGGTVPGPTYEHHPGYVEAVRVVYDPARTTYDALLSAFWHNVDPFDPDGQFCDQGASYRPVIFVADDAQRAAALASKKAAEQRLGKPTVVPIEPAGTFWVAEAYHQDYAERNSWKYRYYRWSCGRDARLDEVWGEDARR